MDVSRESSPGVGFTGGGPGSAEPQLGRAYGGDHGGGNIFGKAFSGSWKGVSGNVIFAEFFAGCAWQDLGL